MAEEDPFKKQLETLKKLRAEATDYRKEMDGISRQAKKDQVESVNREIEKIKLLVEQKKITEENGKELVAIAEKQKRAYLSMYEVTGRITQEVNTTYRSFQNFLTTSADQYNYAQKIAKEYLMVSRNIGASGAHQERLTRNFKDTLPEIENMGGSMEDITSMMETFADESGRMRILDQEDIVNIEKISKGINLSASETAKMAEMFDLMGVSTNSMTEGLENVYKESQKLGLNAAKVVKQLSSNMKSIQSYSFSSGVRGMTEMAKQAVRMRLDVSDVLQMADKFYQPEAAIEAAANLQMLGGDIAQAFGDPFETMYMARNKPEELAKKLGDMTENMLQFNEESGRYELPAEARMQLKAAGDQLGINTEKMVEMARQSSKIKDLKMKFTSIGDNDIKENLASLAKFSEEKGEFVIQHNGEELGLDEVNESMVDEIMEANANEGKSDSDLFKNIAINTQTMSEQMQSALESSKAAIAGTTDLYEIGAENMKQLTTPMKASMDAAVKSFQENFKPESLFQTEGWKNSTEEFGKQLGEMGDDINDFIKNLPKIPKSSNNDGGPVNNDEGPGGDGGPLAMTTKKFDYTISITGDLDPSLMAAFQTKIQNNVKSWVVDSAEIKNSGGNWEIDFT